MLFVKFYIYRYSFVKSNFVQMFFVFKVVLTAATFGVHIVVPKLAMPINKRIAGVALSFAFARVAAQS